MISRILLVNTPRISAEELNKMGKREKFHEVYPPLGLMYLSAMLKRDLKGVEVKILDLHYEGIRSAYEEHKVDWEEICNKAIRDFKPDLVGFSVLFGASFQTARGICLKIKENHPKILLIIGGVHVSSLAKEGRVIDFCDLVAMYESEYHLLGLIRYLNGEQDTVKGIVFNNKALLRDPQHLLTDIERPASLDDLPSPDFDAVDLRNYYKYGILSGAQTVSDDTPIATLLTTRGCKAHCKFCSVRSFNGASMRSHSTERVLRDIDTLYNTFGIRHIDFVDDDLTYDRDLTRELFTGIIERKYDLTWSVGNGVRIGTLTDETLDLMVRSGCTYFSIGVESGDPEVLKEIRKPLGLKMLKEKVKLLHHFPQIYYRANFILGFPGETPQQMDMTFSVATELALDWNLFSICKPLPGTDLYQDFFKLFPNAKTDMTSENLDFRFNSSSGMFIEEDKRQSLFDFIYTKNLEINFKNNVNLAGRNIDRAIRDFERITRIAPEHAFAWNCLAIAYKKTNNPRTQLAMSKVQEIIKTSEYWQKKFEVVNFPVESAQVMVTT